MAGMCRIIPFLPGELWRGILLSLQNVRLHLGYAASEGGGMGSMPERPLQSLGIACHLDTHCLKHKMQCTHWVQCFRLELLQVGDRVICKCLKAFFSLDPGRFRESGQAVSEENSRFSTKLLEKREIFHSCGALC